MMPFGFPPCGFPSSPAGALSLLSSARGGAPWLIPTAAAADISARSSAALDELIAENRAAILAWQLFSDRSPGGRLALLPPPSMVGRVVPGEVPGWHATQQFQAHTSPGGRADGDDGPAGRYGFLEAPAGTGHTTLDLMQAPPASAGTPFRPVPERAVTAKKDAAAAGCSSDAWAPVPGRVV